jgi:hypothetical protein
MTSKLDQKDREFISSDLTSLCKFEMEEAISGRNAEWDLKMFGCAWASALYCKEWAERRLQLLPNLTRAPTWHRDFEVIRDCINGLDAYIAEQEEE